MLRNGLAVQLDAFDAFGPLLKFVKGATTLLMAGRGTSTLRRPVSEENQNSSGNLKVLPGIGIGDSGKFSGNMK